jgi:hypothetical protein
MDRLFATSTVSAGRASIGASFASSDTGDQGIILVIGRGGGLTQQRIGGLSAVTMRFKRRTDVAVVPGRRSSQGIAVHLISLDCVDRIGRIT